MSGRGIDLVNSTVPFRSVAIIKVSILGKSGWPTSIPSDMMDDSHIRFDLPLNQPTLSRDERIFFTKKFNGCRCDGEFCCRTIEETS